MMRVLLVLALLSAGLGIAGAQQFDWPQWRGPDGNGVSRETAWNPNALDGGPRVLWKANVGVGHSGVSIQNGRLCTIGSKGMKPIAFCLSAETGEEIWRYPFTSPYLGPPATIAQHDGLVYALSGEGMLYCLRAPDGGLEWKRDLVHELGAVEPYYNFAASPVIDRNLLLLAVNSAGMALDAKTGAKVWGSEKPPKARYKVPEVSTGVEYSSPVVYEQGGKRLMVVCSWSGVHGVEVGTGKPAWALDWGAPYDAIGVQVADPLVFDGKLLIVPYREGALAVALYDLGARPPRAVWQLPGVGSNIASPVFLNGCLFVCKGGPDSPKGSGSLACIDALTGRQAWERSFDGKPVTLTAADGKLIILTEDGTLAIGEASAAGFTEISRCDVLAGAKKTRIFWTPPVLCNGRIFIRNYAGDLICIDVSR